MIITHTLDVYRFSKTGNDTEYSATPAYSGVDCFITPASTDLIAIFPELPAFSSYEAFVFENVDLKLGDKLTDGSEEFIVRGVPQVFRTSYISYQRLMCEKVV